MSYRVEFKEAAKKQLLSIQDRRIREKLLARAQELANEPEKQGKELGGDLESYRSVRAVGQRYRIVYRIEADIVVVVVVMVGIRKAGDKKDVYKLAQRLVRLGLMADLPVSPDDASSDEPMPEEPTLPDESEPRQS